MKLILEGVLENISTRNDGTIKFTFGTQELDSGMAGSLFQLRGKYAKCLLSDSNITSLEAETVDSASLVGSKKNKTESQRLRAVLFRLHEQQQSDIDFELFYKQEMNKIIEHYKSKLE